MLQIQAREIDMLKKNTSTNEKIQPIRPGIRSTGFFFGDFDSLLEHSHKRSNK
jgi:hypothetical protein